MNKVSKLFKALGLIIKQPSLLNHVINSDEAMKAQVVKKYNLPHGLKSVDLLDLVPGFHETVFPFSGLEGSSTPLDIALLRSLAKSYTHCSFLEIGTWRGESVANVAFVAHDCVTVNLPDEEMLAMGHHEKYVGLHRFFSNKLKNVMHLQKNSRTFDFKTLNKKFDLIFVDGDHHYESVKNDTAKVFELLRDESSVIVWHDYLRHSGEVRYEVLAGILDGAPAPFRNNIYSVSNTLCAIFTRKSYPAAFPEQHSNPNKVFNIEIKALRDF